MTGPVSSLIALIVASLGAIPLSMWYEAPSTITIASSTTMPIARMRAKSVMRFTVKPSAAIAMKAPIMVTGTVVAGTSIARKLWRKRSTTISTRNAGYEESFIYLRDRLADKQGGVIADSVFESFGKILAHIGHCLIDVVGNGNGICVRKCENRDQGRFVAAENGEISVVLLAQLDSG